MSSVSGWLSRHSYIGLPEKPLDHFKKELNNSAGISRRCINPSSCQSGVHPPGLKYLTILMSIMRLTDVGNQDKNGHALVSQLILVRMTFLDLGDGGLMES